MSAKWDARFMEMARLVAGNSKDRSSQVGCVIVDDWNAVLSTGYNGFPRLVNDDVESRYKRPAKYLFTVHAEGNAVANAARRGVSLAGSTAFVNWFPCACCTGLFLQAGITTVVGYRPSLEDGRWVEEHQAAIEMLTEAGISIRYLEGRRLKVKEKQAEK